MQRIASVLVVLGCAIATAYAQADDPARSAQEAQTKQKLDQVRDRIKALVAQRNDTTAQRSDALAALREQELKIATTARQLRALDEQLEAQQGKLDELGKHRAVLDDTLKEQRAALAALLRSVYAMGRNEELKLLLAQDNAADIARMLGYYRYFERARLGEIDAVLKSLDALAQVQHEIAAQNAELEKTRGEQSQQAAQLQSERGVRQQVLAQLDSTLKDQKSRLAALGRDEKALIDLLAKLHDIFADIPAHPVGAEAFADLRGKLPWPLHGEIAQVFGVSVEGARAAQGLLIASPSGADVHAVSNGRVVFADWLRGYGLLLIIDHGDGYLSLYGDNETLLKDVGDWVEAGTTIATSGNSGGKSTPGLYFELRYKGKAVDPVPWLRATHY